MPTITFKDRTGVDRVVDVATGGSLMQAAVDNQIAGIDADCGGACACATCHVYLPADLAVRIPAPDDMEQSMLEFAENVAENSRLSCQITVTDDFDGVEIIVPEEV